MIGKAVLVNLKKPSKTNGEVLPVTGQNFLEKDVVSIPHRLSLPTKMAKTIWLVESLPLCHRRRKQRGFSESSGMEARPGSEINPEMHFPFVPIALLT